MWRRQYRGGRRYASIHSENETAAYVSVEDIRSLCVCIRAFTLATQRQVLHRQQMNCVEVVDVPEELKYVCAASKNGLHLTKLHAKEACMATV